MLLFVILFLVALIAGFASGVLLSKLILSDVAKLRADFEQFQTNVINDLFDFAHNVNDLRTRVEGAAASEMKSVEADAKSAVAAVESEAKKIL